MIDFYVLGSGISGSTIANLLLKNKYTVGIIDKARGVGGRCSNKKIGKGKSFDHGLQYFSSEEKDFYIDCGGWLTWREAIQIARKEGKDKKFVIFTQPEEEMAHEEECMCLAFGVGKENPSLDEIRIVGKQVYAFLDSEGFEMGWDEDPDSYITIGLDKDLQNAKDPFHLVLEIHVPDEDVIK